jgi:hypothetical protein
MGGIGFALSVCSGPLSSVRSSVTFHSTIIVGWEAARATTGLTVGDSPLLKMFAEL